MKEKGVIWVGTDDGQVQLTRDGGKTWTNMTPKIAGMPKGAWIPQLNASTYNAGEVFVVVNNYRQFDYKPYLFRSKDYGQTWENMTSGSQLGAGNYTLAVVQDPVEPSLFFVGTENGLFVSLDEGKTYSKWTNGFPAGVPTMDLVIHPREHDLVIGTFGRSFYILDDIRPLRELAKTKAQALTKTVHLFTPPDAYLADYQFPNGIRFPANGMFLGENRPAGAMISYVSNKPEEKPAVVPAAKAAEPKKGKAKTELKIEEPKMDEKSKVKYDSLTLEVFTAQGQKIYTKKEKAAPDNGVNRMIWNLTETGLYPPSREKIPATVPEPAGLTVIPGSYKLRLTFGGQKDSTTLTVKADPRYPEHGSVLQARYAMLKDLQNMTGIATKAMTRLRESKEVTDSYEKQLKEAKRDDLKVATEKTKAVKDSISSLMDFIVGEVTKRQGFSAPVKRPPTYYVTTAKSYIGTSKDPVSATDQRVFKQAEEQITTMISRVNEFYEKAWTEYRTLMEKINLSPFKEYESLRIK